LVNSRHGKKSPRKLRRSERASTIPTDLSINKNLFDKNCVVCGKDRIQRSKKNEFPTVIKTSKVEKTIKLAAKDKIPSLYYKIKDEDLIAKELRYHNSCYKLVTVKQFETKCGKQF